MGKAVVPLRGHALVKISRSHKNRKACNAMEKQYSAVGEGLGGVGTPPSASVDAFRRDCCLCRIQFPGKFDVVRNSKKL